MTTPVKIIGSYLSPYVRKVLAVLHLKGIAYEIDPIVAFLGDDRFSKLSPLRRIPVLIDDRVTLCDSTVICQYLEDRHPRPRLYPADAADGAKARWLEEYADTRMGDVFIWQLFNQVAIGPYVWGRPTDDVALRKTINEEMPQVLEYLESQLPALGFLFGELSIADISVAVFFRNAAFARYVLDASRFPRTAAFVERVLAQDCLAQLKPFEEKMLRTPIAKHREALTAMGAPILAETYGTTSPRRGLMRI
ncbi:MAG TPA: glutathione S-transferase family protein [Nevskiaceae bacterium]|nr:glutathione S-transferase family protein [Nevskiaceae bacterium]